MKWLGNFPDPFLAEIAGQPDALRRAAGALADDRSTLQSLAERTAGVVGVVFTGMGSSYDACYPAVNELAARGVLAVHVDTAELLHFRTNLLAPGTPLVVVSQSGRSAEVVRLAELVADRPDRPLVLSVTNGLDNVLGDRADLRLDTRAGVETGPSTMTFAASIVQLAGVAGAMSGRPVGTSVEGITTAAEETAAAIEAMLDDATEIGERLAGAVSGRGVVAVLGRGPARAAAEMGALTLKESGVMAESFATAAFRHGPFELAGPDLAAIVLATEPETRTLDLGLAGDLVAAGASVVVVGPRDQAPPGPTIVPFPPLHRLLAPAASVVPIQLLARRLATELGRVPGAYTTASKVTTRE
jgi:glucosamine--fructose-6-phosphate aminotransferase (isomerizing)